VLLVFVLLLFFFFSYIWYIIEVAVMVGKCKLENLLASPTDGVDLSRTLFVELKKEFHVYIYRFFI